MSIFIFAWVFGSFGDIVSLTQLLIKIARTFVLLRGNDSPDWLLQLVNELESLSKITDKVELIIKAQRAMETPDVDPRLIDELEELLKSCQESAKDMDDHLKMLQKKFKTPVLGLGSGGRWGTTLYKVGWSFVGYDKATRWTTEIRGHYEQISAIVSILGKCIPENGKENKEVLGQQQDSFPMIFIEFPKGKKFPDGLRSRIDWSCFNTPEKRKEFIKLQYDKSPKYRRKLQRNEFKFIHPQNLNPNLDDNRDEIEVEVGAYVKLAWLPRRPPVETYRWPVPRIDAKRDPVDVRLPDSPEPSDSELASEDEDESPNPVQPTFFRPLGFRASSPKNIPLPFSQPSSVESLSLEAEQTELGLPESQLPSPLKHKQGLATIQTEAPN